MEVDVTLKIEAGKYYRTRDGRKVGPMYKSDGEWVCDNMIDEYIPMWNLKTGVANFTTEGPKSDYPQYDLIAEWADEPAAPKLWRDMTPGTQVQVFRDGRGWQDGFTFLAYHSVDPGYWAEVDPSWAGDCKFRIRPEPKRETVALCWKKCLAMQQIGTIDLINGKPDPASVKLDEI
jgi:hypothetical protein